MQREACAPPLESSPHSLYVEKAHAQQRRPSTVKKKIFNVTILIIIQSKCLSCTQAQLCARAKDKGQKQRNSNNSSCPQEASILEEDKVPIEKTLKNNNTRIQQVTQLTKKLMNK